MKLAFVVQRYGADIAGGSEAHCRELALRLAGHHDITVLTTCARDYVTWATRCPPASRARWRARAALSGGASAPAEGLRRSDGRDSRRRGPPSSRRPGSARTARSSRRCSTTCVSTAPATTSCCSGRSATTRRSSVCRSWPTARARAHGGRGPCRHARRARGLLPPARRLPVHDPGRRGARLRRARAVRCSRLRRSASGLDPVTPVADRARRARRARRPGGLRAVSRAHRSQQGLPDAARLLSGLCRA